MNDWNLRSIITNVDDKMSSYSRFLYTDDCGIKFGCDVKPKSEPWESIDNIVISTNLGIVKSQRIPADMQGLEVPYKCENQCTKPYIITPNYNVWPSDHALNMYVIRSWSVYNPYIV